MIKPMALALICVVLFFWACSSEDVEIPEDSTISLNESEIEIDYGRSFQLIAGFNRSGYHPDSLVWESSDDKVATVEENGRVTGQKVGQAVITVRTEDDQFSATCEVTVNPTNFLYREPVLDFSMGSEQIVQEEERKFLGSETEQGDGVILTFLTFEGENDEVREVVYSFIDDLYSYSRIDIIRSIGANQRAHDFLSQRYELVDQFDDEGIYVFLSDQILCFLLEDEELGPLITYYENDGYFWEEDRIDIDKVRVIKYSKKDM
jgi:hypothetical protein